MTRRRWVNVALRARWPSGLNFALGSAILAVALTPSCHGPGVEGPPAVILVIVDTLRADHLSSYGYGRPTSPNLDRLAGEGELYRRAYAQSSWTLPAVATILTGRLPQAHGAGGDSPRTLHPLRPEVPTLAEGLKASGFRTAAFINVVFCAPSSGLSRGFEVYDFRTSDASNRGHRDARATTDAALAWMGEVRDEPFFLVVHYFDPHLTYDPPAPFDVMFEPDAEEHLPEGFGNVSQVFGLREGRLRLSPRQRASLIARYDGEIRFVDEQFARLREGLERLGRWERSMVIVVADHGEEFWDHGGFEHGHSHHRELLHVPLIVKAPDRPPAVREERARQLDIAPTVLDYAGVGPPRNLPGLVLGHGEAPFSVAAGSLWAGDLLSIRSVRGTLILNRTTGRREFFAPDDPGETRAVSDRWPEAARQLEQILLALSEARDDEDIWQLTDQQLEQLRALGYIR